MSEKRLGQITLANAWYCKPRVVSGGGRRSIKWPVKDQEVNPEKRLAKEIIESRAYLAQILLREEEVDGDERDMGEAVKEEDAQEGMHLGGRMSLGRRLRKWMRRLRSAII